MNRLTRCFPVSFAASVLVACVAPKATAQVGFYYLYYTGYQVQLDDGPVAPPYSWAFYAGLINFGTEDSAEAQLTVPGQPEPILMPRVDDYSYLYGPLFGSQAELLATFPAGDYTMRISGGLLGDLSENLPCNSAWWPDAQPYFTNGTHTAMQAIDPTQDFVVTFNAYAPVPPANMPLTFFGAYDYGSQQYAYFAVAQQPATEFIIPANTLSPGGEFQFNIWHSNREEYCCEGFGGTADRSVGFEYSTATTGFTIAGTPCPADFNQDGGVDGADVSDFFAAWEIGDAIADVNQDGGVDGADVTTFFVAWENGGC
ncbi:MAG: hypothetical protein JSR77_04300 [Planctomycetes bacterium]|nr:hypothetical protein [Planctomycetota bacterium]